MFSAECETSGAQGTFVILKSGLAAPPLRFLINTLHDHALCSFYLSNHVPLRGHQQQLILTSNS